MTLKKLVSFIYRFSLIFFILLYLTVCYVNEKSSEKKLYLFLPTVDFKMSRDILNVYHGYEIYS